MSRKPAVEHAVHPGASEASSPSFRCVRRPGRDFGSVDLAGMHTAARSTVGVPLRGAVKNIAAARSHPVGETVPSPLPPLRRPPLRTPAVLAGLFLGTLALFSRAVHYGFVNYDDPRYVTNNAHVQGGLTWDGIVWAFTGHADYWHPLSWLSHMLDWQLYADHAQGHHLTSVLWHALNATLVFLVLRRLTGATWTSVLAAALFAWHPLRVESVAWITERKDVMSGCFFLLTLWAYAAYADRRRAGRSSAGAYALTLACFVAGLMSKPMIVSLPAVLLVLDFWPLGGRPWRSLILEKVPFFLLSIGTGIVTTRMQEAEGAFTLPLPLGARLGNAVVSIVRYIGKFFRPFDLAVAYPHPGYWPGWIVAACAAAVLALTALAWWQRRTRPWLLAGWLWFLIVLGPATGIVQVGFQSMADRYTYLPILGLELMLLWTWREFALRPAMRVASAVVATVVLAGCAARTWDQEAVWRDPVTLFTHAIAVTDRNHIAEGFLGYTLAGLGRFEEAAVHSERALAIDPDNTTALTTLGSVRDQQGRVDEAIALLHRLLVLKPGDTEVEFSLGLALLRAGRTAEATPHLRTAVDRQPALIPANLRLALTALQQGRTQDAGLRYQAAAVLEPDDAGARFGLGLALRALGFTDAALARFQETIELDPAHAAAQAALGVILLERGSAEEAARHFRAALARQPDLGLALLGLGRAESKLGRTDEAAASFERAAACAPNDPAAQRAWAETLARRGRFGEAVHYYERAVRLSPADASAHAELGYSLLFAGRHAEAVAQWQEALRLDPAFPQLRERLEKLRTP